MILTETPRLDLDQPIYYPGELEELTQQQRSKSGIPVQQYLVNESITTTQKLL